ncbi:MAG TPA: hypothetical protein VFP97_14380 [Chitinophagaceae bacterium]|nr:hypothetical protein [Chitinophagaceae bacterium]
MSQPIAALHLKRCTILLVLLILFSVGMQSCYHYRVINTKNDPATEYRDTVMRSFLWGLINKPQNFQVKNCTDSCAAIDEVVFSKNFGQSLVSFITLGIVSSVKVEWKCHKPCQRTIDGL